MYMLPIKVPDQFVVLLTKNRRLGASELRSLLEATNVKTYSAHGKLRPLLYLLGDAKCISDKKDRQDFWSSARGWPDKYYFSIFAPTAVAATMLYLKHAQEVFLAVNVTLDALSDLDDLVERHNDENAALREWEHYINQLAHVPKRHPQNIPIRTLANQIDFEALKLDVYDPQNIVSNQLRQRISDWLDQHLVK